MARAYRLTLEPEDTSTREVYYIEGDDFDEEHELTTDDGDAFDAVVSDNDGYYVAEVERVDIETARQNHPYEM